jgi:hypothetical protein
MGLTQRPATDPANVKCYHCGGPHFKKNRRTGWVCKNSVSASAAAQDHFPASFNQPLTQASQERKTFAEAVTGAVANKPALQQASHLVQINALTREVQELRAQVAKFVLLHAALHQACANTSLPCCPVVKPAAEAKTPIAPVLTSKPDSKQEPAAAAAQPSSAVPASLPALSLNQPLWSERLQEELSELLIPFAKAKPTVQEKMRQQIKALLQRREQAFQSQDRLSLEDSKAALQAFCVISALHRHHGLQPFETDHAMNIRDNGNRVLHPRLLDKTSTPSREVKTKTDQNMTLLKHHMASPCSSATAKGWKVASPNSRSNGTLFRRIAKLAPLSLNTDSAGELKTASVTTKPQQPISAKPVNMVAADKITSPRKRPRSDSQDQPSLQISTNVVDTTNTGDRQASDRAHESVKKRARSVAGAIATA